MAFSRPDFVILKIQNCAMRLALAVEEVQNGRQQDDEQQRLEVFEHDLQPDAAHGDDHRQKRRHDHIGDEPLGKEQRDDIDDHEHELRARVELMDGGAAGEKLTEGHIFQHVGRPPFRSGASRSAACSTV